MKETALLPKNEMPALLRSSGSLGFSDAWPQPAQTACKEQCAQKQTVVYLQAEKVTTEYTTVCPC